MTRVSPPYLFRRLVLVIGLVGSFASLSFVQAEEQSIPSKILGFMEIEDGSASILYGEDDQWLAARLAEILQPVLKKIKLVPSRGAKPRHDDLVIYLGSFESNLTSKKVFKDLGFKLLWNFLPAGSYMLKTHRHKGKTTLFLTGKDHEGTVYAVQEAQKFYFHAHGNRLFLNDMTYVTQPDLLFRRAWLSTSGVGASAETLDQKDLPAMVRQWEQELDEAGHLRFNGVCLEGNWPATPDSSDLLGKLDQMANQRGLKLIPVLSLPFEDGKTKRVEATQKTGAGEAPIAAINPAPSVPLDQNSACPANPILQRQLLDQMKWFFSQARLDSLYFAYRPLQACSCPVCQAERRKLNLACPDSFKDLLRWASFLGQEANRLNPKATLSIAVPFGFGTSDLSAPERKETMSLPQQNPWMTLPRNILLEWDLNSMIEEQQWPSPFKAPALKNLGLLHLDPQGSLGLNQILYGTILEIIRQVKSSNLSGLSYRGSLTGGTAQAILNRLAFSEFAFNSEAKSQGAFRNKLARYFGGPDSAKALFSLLTLFDDESGWNVEKSREASLLVQKGLSLSEPEGKGNWMQLDEYVKQLSH